MAKVATRADSAEGLVREHQLTRALAALGARVARPLPGTAPIRHRTTGFLVTLWCRLEHDGTAEVPEATLGLSLRLLHETLALAQVELPCFRDGLERARTVLADDALIPALADHDRLLLRAAFDDLLAQLDDRALTAQALHGEPHAGNVLCTPTGLHWIDFESACRGPLEWHLAFLPDGARTAFTGIDRNLLLGPARGAEQRSCRHLVLGQGPLPRDAQTRRAPSRSCEVGVARAWLNGKGSICRVVGCNTSTGDEMTMALRRRGRGWIGRHPAVAR